MSQVTPIFTFECRSNEVSYCSQATSTKAFPGEFQGENVGRRLLSSDEIQLSLATTTFLGKQQKKRSAVRNENVTAHAVPREDVALVQQPASVPVQRSRLPWTPVNQCSVQQVVPFYQLLTFIPRACLGTEILSTPCSNGHDTTSNFCLETGNQNQQGTLMSDKVTNCESSVKLAPYSEPASTHSGPETTECSYSACNGAPHSHKEPQTNDALIAMSQLLAEASDLADAFALGEIRFEEQTTTESCVTETMSVDVTNSESVTVTTVVDEVPREKTSGENQVHEWCNLQDLFGLDLSDTKALLDGTYNDKDTDSVCDMYLPPKVPSTCDVNEVLSSKEFSDLIELIDDIKPESRSSSETVDAQCMSVKSPSKCVSDHDKEPMDPLCQYVPDMFLFSKSEPDQVKFDLFDFLPADSMASDLQSDVTSSRKRKRFSSEVTNKRQRVWNQVPELNI